MTTSSALDWPNPTNEHWRFGLWKEANLSDLTPVGAGTSAPLPPEIEGATRFVFQNAQLVSGESPHVTLLERSFGPQSRLGSPKLAALHTEHSQHGLVIAATQDALIEIIHLVSGDGILLPSLTISAEKGAHVTVVERFISADDTPTTVLSACHLHLAEEAEATYLVTQELNLSSRFIRLADSQLEAASHAIQSVIHTGARWVREEVYSTVNGADAKSEILSLALPHGSQHYDQRTFQHHGAQHTYSDLLFKNTLFDTASTVFSGLIFVDEGAHHTDAYQTCRNLLMSDTCEANSMPGLEINADQVKCSHGSTSAAVSDEEIYYLQARGIPADEARRLIAQGFSQEVIERLRSEPLQQLAEAVVASRFTR